MRRDKWHDLIMAQGVMEFIAIMLCKSNDSKITAKGRDEDEELMFILRTLLRFYL